jgi:pSer/pThr/pTyr-binding forkhead associated (FHA) protein
VLAKFFCRTGELAGSEFGIAAEASIGKDPGNSIVLTPAIISSRHARIYYDENEKCYFIEDLGSRNGTKLDGMKVTQKERLGNLEVITFADVYDFIFQMLPEGQEFVPRGAGHGTVTDQELPPVPLQIPGAPAAHGTVAAPDVPVLPNLQPGKVHTGTVMDSDIPMVPASMQKAEKGKTVHEAEMVAIPQFQPGAPPVQQPVAPAVPQSYLLQLKKDQKTFTLKEGENIVGRTKDTAISIDHSTVSRKHASVTLNSGRVTIKDLGSSNHTFVDDKRITAEVEVTPQSRIKFGAVEATLIPK